MRFAVLPLVLLSLSAAQAADLSVTADIKGPDGGWDYATIDKAGNRLLLARSDGLMAVDLATNAVTPALVKGARMHGSVIAPNGIGVVGNGGGNSAIVFTGSDGTKLAEIPAGKKPDAVIYDAKTGLAAVMDNQGGTVTLIDVEKKEAAGTIEVGGALEFAAADGEGKVFVNIEDKNQLAVLDLTTRKVVARRPLPGCDGPSGLAFDPANHVLVSACGNGKAIATSSVDGHVIATLKIGSHPDAVLFDEKKKRFLVPCGGDGVLTVISAENGHLEVTGSIPTAPGVRLGAIDPATGKIYLPAAEYDPPAKPGERPAMKPGSFHIMVMSEK